MLRNMALPSLVAAVAVFVVAALANAQVPPSPATTSQTVQRVSGSLEMYVDEMPEMRKINSYRVQRKDHRSSVADITIGMYAKTWKFHRDLPPTRVFAYGTSKAAASVPGPTIIARRGVPLSIRWENHLPHRHILPWDPTITTAIPKHGGVPTVVHVHGSTHSPSNDGNPQAWFTNGYRETGPHWSQATYTYPNIQPSGNLWYHDHTVGLTRVNVLAGLLGVYIIRNSSFDRGLHLPSGHEYDRHIVIFDRSFNTDGSIYVNSTGVYPQLHPQWQPEYFGDAILVNGKAWPYLTVRRRRYRFRILNASNARYLRLSLSNGLPFYVIGSDASYLSSPVRTQTILLGPAEGADVVVDFSKCSLTSAELINDAPYPYPSGTPVGPLTGKVMKFNILPMMAGELPDNSTMPTSIADYCGVTMEGATVRRHIALYEYSVNGKVTHLDINGLHFMDPVTETPRAGSTEIWYVINLTNDNHPLHIHLGMSQAVKVQEILDLPTFKSCMMKSYDAVNCNVDGHARGRVIHVPEHERTWKNVVKIEPGYVTTIVVDFEVPDTKMPYTFDATAEPGYVYHCHMLEHEDNVMMRPLKLLPENA